MMNSPAAEDISLTAWSGTSNSISHEAAAINEPGLVADSMTREPSPHLRFSHSRSMPGSPGAWGSAVKIHEHGTPDAGPNTRSGGMDGLMARIAMMRMAEAAAAASTDGGSTISLPGSEAGASIDGSSSGSPIMSGRASPAMMSARVSPLLPLANRPLLSASGSSAAADPGRDCGSPMAAGQPESSMTVLTSASAWAAEASVPSPRGVAALMISAGVGTATVSGQEADNMLAPQLAADVTVLAAPNK